MKLSLIVVGGVHDGKAIPVNVPQFVIGRDPQCQLRPASPSISKRHCAIFVRGRQILIRDFGSTNGTFVNEQLVEGEVPLKEGDAIKVGPLSFKVSLTSSAASSSAPQATTAATVGDVPSDGETVELSAPESGGPSSDKLAAALLLDDEPRAKAGPVDPDGIPEGSTVMEIPAQAQAGGAPGGPAAAAPAAKKSVVGSGNTSDAAAEILKRYQRRPRSS